MIIRLLEQTPSITNNKTILIIKDLINQSFSQTSSTNYLKKIYEYIDSSDSSPFQKIIFIAENNKTVQAFALLSYNSEINFMFLDCLAVEPCNKGKGIGQFLYNHLRTHTKNLSAKALFFECVIDNPSLVKSPDELSENMARLRFYKKFGACPIIGSKWEEPDDDDIASPSFLMLDNLDNKDMPTSKYTKDVVRCLLENKFSYCCSPQNIAMVVNSFNDNPIKIRT